MLKSLNVIVYDGGQVLSIDYETPADRAKVLGDLSVKLDKRSSLVDLFSSLRGADVTLWLGEHTSSRGRVIGVESSLDADVQPPVVLLQQESDVQAVALNQVQRLSIHEERFAANIGYFLDVSSTEETRTTLTVRLSEGVHDLGITYQAPSPTWRVSYRLVGDGQGQARFMGWGLFDNSLEEDLNEVQLTLMSGRPISFEYALYESQVPSRPQVSDDLSVHEAFAANPVSMEVIATLSHELRTPITSMKGYAQLLLGNAAGDLTAEQRRFVQVIATNADNLSKMISDLLKLCVFKQQAFDKWCQGQSLRWRVQKRVG